MCRDSRDTNVPPTLETINRFPILIGFESARVNCFSQLRGKASMWPPNPLSSADEPLHDRHTISNSNRSRPGLRTTTSWPAACFWRSSSCALTQCRAAVLRHRYTEKCSASQGWPASPGLERLGRPAFAKATARSLQARAGAGDEARTRDVHLGKVVLYQLSYTRSFERDNNVQPSEPRNLLIASEYSKSLNPN